MKIAIIGTGNLGLSIAKGLITNNTITSLYLTKRKPESIQYWAEHENVSITSDNREAVKASDILIFAIQPRHFEAVLKEIADLLTDKHVLISTITGFKISSIEAVVGADQYIIRSMPNTAISVGKSVTCICSNTKGKDRINIASAIFNGLGTSIEIPEEQMQAATVICASGIAFWMRLIRATTQGAIQLGFEADIAQEMAMQTCLGAATLLVESGNHPEEEIDRVTTPRGCTIEGLNEMEHQGLSSSLIKGLVTSFNKINQI
ncbi:MAG TPA: pyrroline-5-carboxylate reductase [Flavobacteriaceae bacterium]|jgi:pyrroline-5-carboxylate reductase|nr:pyrroline-5-carboxylate reductase [Flavobacteriaceae bacterium]HBS11440.1 pyrroline-5-carboxylate reductase [Flavobacteriaceae bacterium]